MDSPSIIGLTNFIDMAHSARFKVGKPVLFAMVNRYGKIMPVYKLCRLLAVSKSGYYKWLQRQTQLDRDLTLRDKILTIQQFSDHSIGHRRMVEYLKRHYALTVNHKKVYRVMKKYGILARTAMRKKYNCMRKAARAYPNLVNGDFSAPEPNAKWCTDITEYQTTEGKIYLSVIEDFYDRSVVSYSISSVQNQLLVKDTIEKALQQITLRPEQKIILHSDQGNLYRGKKYDRLAGQHQLTPSMSKKATPADNAVIESFFATLKKECLYRYEFETRSDAIVAIEEYIIFYNNLRIQKRTGCTPHEIRFGIACSIIRNLAAV